MVHQQIDPPRRVKAIPRSKRRGVFPGVSVQRASLTARQRRNIAQTQA
jgi:hypothetical protein